MIVKESRGKEEGGVILLSGPDKLWGATVQHLTHQVFEELKDRFCGLVLHIQLLGDSDLFEQKLPHSMRIK